MILKYFRFQDFRKGEYIFQSIYNEYEDNPKKDSFKEIVEELKTLIKYKKKITFNEEWGVGEVYYKEDKFLIELHYYGSISYPIGTKDLNEVAKWLIRFSKKGERMDDGRAMSVAFGKDMMSQKERRELIKKQEEIKEKEFKKIK